MDFLTVLNFSKYLYLIFVLLLIVKKYFLKREAKIIILTGSIGVGKTTVGKEIVKYVTSKGLRAYMPEEMSLTIKPELDLFYKDKKNNALFFQNLILEEYKKISKHIFDIIGDYDYIILDRTYRDTEIFTLLNIEDGDCIKYLEDKRVNIKFPDQYVYRTIYVKPTVENMLERQFERNRAGEISDKEYFVSVYNIYEVSVPNIYPNHIVFENNFGVSEYHKYFKKLIGI
jgi:deoxyadenosine/deoxycytidine kinase